MLKKWEGFVGSGFIILIMAFHLIGAGTLWDMSSFQWVMWPLLLVFNTLYTVIYTIPVLQMVINHRGAKSRRPQDISSENRQPPPKAAQLIQELNGLGFTRLGETLTKIPFTISGVTWILVSYDGTDTVEVADLGKRLFAAAGISTVYQDEAVLQTTYPVGEDKDFPLLRIRSNTTSLLAAYQQHVHESALMQAQHGKPRLFQNMAEYLQRDVRFRELHIAHQMGNIILLPIAKTIWHLVLTLTMMFVILVNRDLTLVSRDQFDMVILLVTVFLTIFGWFIWRLIKANQPLFTTLMNAKNHS